MPMIDMPLEELRVYNGISPCPADIDEYWERALKEMNDTEPNPEFIPSDFKIPGFLCYDLYFDGVRNSKIHCKFMRKEKIDGKAPAVLKFHGYSGNCGDWTSLMPLASLGYVVCAMDARGQGGLSEDKNPVSGNTLRGQITRGLLDSDIDNLYFRQVYLDTAMVARIVMGLDYVDETEVYTYGGSQGGALSIACACLVPQIKKVAALYPFLCDYKRVWKMDMDVRAYEDIRTHLRNFDPTHEKIDEFFEKLGYIDLQNLSKRIKAKVRMYTGLMDNICPPSTQFAMYNKIISEKEVIIYPDFGHEGLYGETDKTIAFFLND